VKELGGTNHEETGEGLARATLSACIIVRDEEERLPACLESVEFCDEIVVVDSGSKDATVRLAEAADARVVRQPWLGFAAQRNVGLDNAHGDWVLEIDADERVTPSLRAEIEAFLTVPPLGVDLGGLPVREVFLGRRLGPSAKHPKYRHRLLRNGAHRHDEHRTVHEGLVPHGPVHPFEGDLIHLLAEGWHEALGDAWRYARLEAGQLEAQLSVPRFLKGAILRPAVKFGYRLVVDGGWRDGWQGLAWIVIECATDSTVWFRHLFGFRGRELGRSGVPEGRHYGARKFTQGSARIVVVAIGASATARAAAWLRSIQADGVDVALIGDCAGDLSGGQIRLRRIPTRSPVALIHALEAEEQLRSIDAVVPFGARARILMRIVPSFLRGTLDYTSVRDLETVVHRSLAARAVQTT
jgi:glycosyltransferase involved in cell wall biosynthesis